MTSTHTAAPTHGSAPPAFVGRGILCAYVGTTTYLHIDDRLGPEGAEAYLDFLAREIDARLRPVTVLYDVASAGPFADARWRKRGGTVLSERREHLRRRVTAFTMYTPTLAVRGLLKATFWLAPPPYPHAVTASLSEATAYLATYDPTLDRAALEVGVVALLRDHAHALDHAREPVTI